MTKLIARLSRYLPMPTIAAYTFDSEGRTIGFRPVDGYLASELGLNSALQTEGELIGRLDVIAGPIEAEKGAVKLEELLGIHEHSHRFNGETMGVIIKPGNGIFGDNDIGIFSEYDAIFNWGMENGRPVHHSDKRRRITVNKDTRLLVADPSSYEIDALKREADSGQVKPILDEVKGQLGDVVAIVHDLRGTLRYNDFYLNAADSEGMKMLTREVYRLAMKFIGTVTSGTVSEGTNFIEWVRRSQPSSYGTFQTFAICDSLTTAQLPPYEQMLVSGKTVGAIKQCLEEVSGNPEFEKLSIAYGQWTNRSTLNSVIIDIPPDEPAEGITQLLLQAEKFGEYVKRRHGEEVTILNKSAVTRGMNSVRLYVRPAELSSGGRLTKGSSLAHFMAQNGFDEINRRIIYISDKYGTEEEISLGRYALIGVEIDPKQQTPKIEPGRYNIPVLVTVPTYLMAAHLLSRVFSEMPTNARFQY